MRIARHLLLLTALLTLAALLTAAPFVAAETQDAVGSTSAPAAVAPGDTAPEADAANCGMGGEKGSCCQACQQHAERVAEGKAKDGSCPCQRARELREKQQR
jgi:hypothetical protein